MDNPLVSICCLTYNHEKYISEAIEGFLMQITTFSYEIVINDDASTDNTPSILKSYCEKFPEKITCIFQSENMYSKGINPFTKYLSPKARGKYIAVCEGDDYWTDPYKLEKQISFHEKKSDYDMSCTNYDKYYQQENRIEIRTFKKYHETISYDQYLLDRSSICTATSVFTKKILNEYLISIPESHRNSWSVGDVPLWLYVLKHSKVRVLDDSTAVYRINQNSASKFTDVNEKYKFRIKGYEIPFYFAKKFGCMEETLQQLNINYHRMHINYAYEAKKPTIAVQSKQYLKDAKALTIDDKLKLYSSNHPKLSNLIEVFLNLNNIRLRITKKIRNVSK